MGDEPNTKIKNFTDLFAWQEGHRLVLMIYDATRGFPKEELFALSSQMKRCAVSITANIAEGFSRQSIKEKKQFYSIGLGSITELQNHLFVARDVGYITREFFNKMFDQCVRVQRITNGLVKSSKTAYT